MNQEVRTAKAYQNTEISTSNRLRLLIMLYEGAIKFVKKARTSLAAADYAGKGNAISRAMAIIFELRNTLDFETGGDVARELERLYQFVNDELVRANLQNLDEPLKNSLRILDILHSAWTELEGNLTKEGETNHSGIGQTDGHYIGINV